MLKIYCLITGDDYRIMSVETPASKKKTVLYAWSVLIPVIIWFITGYLLITEILKGGIITGIITAAICSFLIFILERSIIMSNGNKFITGYRIILGILIALFGALIFDEIIFRNDIDQQLSKNNRAETESELRIFDEKMIPALDSQKAAINKNYQDWDNALKSIREEATGQGGSGIAGYGNITKAKMEVADQYRQNYEYEKAKLEKAEEKFELQRKELETEITGSIKNNSLLHRIKSLFDLVISDNLVFAMYVILTIIMLLFESFVLIVKSSSYETNYELRIKAIEKAGKNKLDKILNREIQTYNPVNDTRDVKSMKNFLKKNVPSIYN